MAQQLAVRLWPGSLSGPPTVSEPVPGVTVQLLTQVVIQKVVEVLSSELLVASRPAHNGKSALSALKHGSVKGASAQVINRYMLSWRQLPAGEMSSRCD